MKRLLNRYTLLRSYRLLLCFFLPFLCRAQIAGFKNYTQEDGLTSSFGYHVKQDLKGFIWIGGDNGLFRFDGVEFKQYNEKSGFKNIEILGCEPMVNDEVFVIPFLKDFGILKNNKLFTAENHPEIKKLKLGNVAPLFICNKSMDQLFICDPDNPKCAYIYTNGKVSEFPLTHLNEFSASIIHCLIYDFDTHNLYFQNSSSSVIAYNLLTKKITPCNMHINSDRAVHTEDRFLAAVKKDTLIVYELTSPFVFKKINSFVIPESIYVIFIDSRDRLWVCLENGGILYFDQSLRDTMSPVKPVKFLENYVIHGLLRDRDGNVWFNTKNNGLIFLSDKVFKNYVHLPVKQNASYFTAIAANKTSVFLGNNACGISIYRSGKLRELTLNKDTKFECRAAFANEDIAIFAQARDAYLVNLSNDKIERLPEVHVVKNVLPYTSNSLLICANWLLYEYNFVSRKLTTLLQERIYTALVYDDDKLFLASFKDLYKFNVKTKRKELFLEGYYFNDLKKVSHHVYAGATKSYGVILFDNNKILRKITEHDGLASNQIKKIAIEDEHTFWASTSLGLSRISLKGGARSVKNFTTIDGLPSDGVSDCVIKNDTIYVATSKGLGIFSIKDLLNQDTSINKEVIINAVSFGGNELLNPAKRFTATYPDNTVIFKLSFLDYTSQGKISYRYKTEGLNEDWQVSNSSKIILNSLPPGEYTFKVYGLGHNGKQSDHYTAYSFEIKPLFWQSRWFYGLIVLTLTGAVIFLITYFIKKRRDKKLRSILYEKKIAELELQAIKAQINPHFIYNCLNSIQFLLYKKDYEETENYLDLFSKMIRKTLVYSEKTFMPILEEMEYLTLYLDMEKLRLQGNFRYVIHAADNVDKNRKIPSLLIQPFVENAIKHGISQLQDREGIVEIRFEYHRQQLVIIIRDNGTGIKDKSLLSKQSDSFGIKLSRKRIEAFRQLFDTDITIEINDLSEQGKHGTEIKLHLNLAP
jgi:ligand-binding sensor domain-containing protein